MTSGGTILKPTEEQNGQVTEDTVFIQQLRTVTIWTTGLMLLLTMIIILPVFERFGAGDIFGDIFFASLLWFLSGSPLAVSFVVARKLGPTVIPNHILLISTIAYGAWYIYVLHDVFTSTYKFAVFALFGIGCFAFPVMFVAWVVSLYLDFHFNRDKEQKMNDEAENHEKTTEPEA